MNEQSKIMWKIIFYYILFYSNKHFLILFPSHFRLVLLFNMMCVKSYHFILREQWLFLFVRFFFISFASSRYRSRWSCIEFRIFFLFCFLHFTSFHFIFIYLVCRLTGDNIRCASRFYDFYFFLFISFHRHFTESLQWFLFFRFRSVVKIVF